MSSSPSRRMSAREFRAFIEGLGERGEQLAARVQNATPGEVPQLEREFKEWESQAAAAESETERRIKMDEQLRKVPRGTGGPATVTREQSIYSPDERTSFVRDLAFQGSDPAAAERLQRHQREMRDLSSADASAGAFAPPLHLQDEWAEFARASRVYANQVRSTPLGGVGMQVTIPRVTGGTSTSTQSENSQVSETDATTDEITVNVRTIAGQQDLSRQALERSEPGLDRVIFADLAASYAATLDQQVLNGNGSAPNVEGVLQNSNVNSVTYNDADPTVAELYPKIAEAVNLVHAGRLLPPDSIFMHPRRWAFMLKALDTSDRPLVVPSGNGQNQVAATGQPAAEGLVGNLMGLPVFVDPNIPTNLGTGNNEDAIIVSRTADGLLMEESQAPRTRVFESVGSDTLTVRLQVFGYVAYTSQRHSKAHAKITGSGLTDPFA
ncbi:phage major capsid protein, HK97 family [Haloechinothrix alba]|uniref:Phage major capsid protein, HK97 family n=1 Tax=Haloechinothrix alba TaxID=664784 RepID=A0A238WSY7_9PSEU|nr:phage major capsid protein [Haloechinothrix alba]SNR49650.1 phage major capsid protein, HK97 family [Haloechinothrix alba]